MRFAIMGSGGLGCLFGGVLTRAGADVTLIARGANLAALRESGLEIHLLGDERFHVQVQATDDPSTVGQVDAVLFCVKAYDVESAARATLPMIGPETLVLPVQNGVDAAEQIAAIVGSGHVVSGVGVSGGTLERPGVVSQKGPNIRALFGPDEVTGGQRAARIAESLNRAGIATTVSAEIERELWEKFLIALVGLGFMSVTRLPLGPTLICPETAEVVREMIDEGVAAGRARGVALAPDATDRAFDRMRPMAAANPGMRGSMYFDLLAGKRLELEAMNGAVVRMGREFDIPTPVNRFVYAALKPYADGAPALPA